MIRKILEITEIDCGDTTCDGCRFKTDFGAMSNSDFRTYSMCDRFQKEVGIPEDALYRDVMDHRARLVLRLPECLEAEQAYNDQEQKELALYEVSE
jgi:hypothetical protein